jgi:hypothetical protein
MGARFLPSGFARRFRTDIRTLFCRHIRGAPTLSERAVALDRMAGATFLACAAISAVWLAGQIVPTSSFDVPPVTESAQADAAATEPGRQTPEAEAASGRMSANEIRQLQSRLMTLGFDPGQIDGIAGPRTLHALNLYRASVELDPVHSVDRATVADLAD